MTGGTFRDKIWNFDLLTKEVLSNQVRLPCNETRQLSTLQYPAGLTEVAKFGHTYRPNFDSKTLVITNL